MATDTLREKGGPWLSETDEARAKGLLRWLKEGKRVAFQHGLGWTVCPTFVVAVRPSKQVAAVNGWTLVLPSLLS